jgi:hypothetical protein
MPVEASTPLDVDATPLPTRSIQIEKEGDHKITVQYVDVETNTIMDEIVLGTTLSQENTERVINFYGQMLLSQTHRPVFVITDLPDGSRLLRAEQPSLWDDIAP